MSTPRLAQVGDIIMSKKFVNGSRDISRRSKVISIKEDCQPQIIERKMTKEEITAAVLKTGSYPQNEWIKEDFSVPDPTRANAKFLIIRAEYAGGGQDGCGHVDDEWHITAQRLNPQGQYDPNAEIIAFYMTGSFHGTVCSQDITFVGHMQKVTTFV